MKDKYLYTHDPIVKKIFLAMLAPTILMNLTTAIGSMADTVIIGHYLDDASLSVVTFATPIYMVINALAALFAVGGCIAMSIDSGKGDKATANKSFSISVEMIVLSGTLLLLAGIFLMDPITHWLGAEEDIFESVKIYARIILIGAPIFALNISLAFFVRNDGRPTLSMIGMFTSIIVDIILNVGFVGALHMGVAGAAYSTVIGQLVSAAVIGSHFFTAKNTLRFRLTFDSTVLRIIKNGGSSALHFVYQFVTILILNHFLSTLAGTNGVVIYTVVFNLSTVSLSVFEGISQTIQPMVSTYYGEKSYRHIRETMRLAFTTVFVVCGLVTVVLEVIPQVVPTVFGIDDAVLIEQSSQAVRIYAAGMIITTANVVLGYYLQSTEQNFTAAVMISLRSLVLFLFFTILLGKFFGMNGVWAAYTAAEVVSFIVCIIMLRIKQRKLGAGETKVDIMLLDEEIKAAQVCLICNCTSDNAEHYRKKVIEVIKEELCLDSTLAYNTESYLLALEEHCASTKKGRFIATELNGKSETIIIRDNLEHCNLKESIDSIINNATESKYGPVLGWNRICLK